MRSKMKKRGISIFIFTIVSLSLFSSPIFSSQDQGTNKKLKILFVTTRFPNPTRAYTDNQIVGLLDKGHEVYILAQSPGSFADYSLIKEYNLLERTYYIDQIENDEEFPAVLDSDIVYCQVGDLGDYCVKLIEEKNMAAKLIVCLRGSDATGVLIKDPHYYDDLFTKADLFMPVCEYFKNNIIENGCDPTKIIVHHSAIDCTKFRYKARIKPQDGTVRFIIVATFLERKGIRYVLYAFDELRKRYPNIKLTIIGGEYKQEKSVIESLIEALNLEQYVTLLGFQFHHQIVTEFHRAHICLLTSCASKTTGTQEGIPNSLMEAMATGLPVISTYHGGIPELVKDDVSGFLVPERDSKLILEKMVYLIEHPERWEPMGRVGSEWVKQEHNKDKAIDKLIDIFFSILEKGNG